jgi:hypothetical protein
MGASWAIARQAGHPIKSTRKGYGRQAQGLRDRLQAMRTAGKAAGIRQAAG